MQGVSIVAIITTSPVYTSQHNRIKLGSRTWASRTPPSKQHLVFVVPVMLAWLVPTLATLVWGQDLAGGVPAMALQTLTLILVSISAMTSLRTPIVLNAGPLYMPTVLFLSHMGQGGNITHAVCGGNHCPVVMFASRLASPVTGNLNFLLNKSVLLPLRRF